MPGRSVTRHPAARKQDLLTCKFCRKTEKATKKNEQRIIDEWRSLPANIWAHRQCMQDHENYLLVRKTRGRLLGQRSLALGRWPLRQVGPGHMTHPASSALLMQTRKSYTQYKKAAFPRVSVQPLGLKPIQSMMSWQGTESFKRIPPLYVGRPGWRAAWVLGKFTRGWRLEEARWRRPCPRQDCCPQLDCLCGIGSPLWWHQLACPFSSTRCHRPDTPAGTSLRPRRARTAALAPLASKNFHACPGRLRLHDGRQFGRHVCVTQRSTYLLPGHACRAPRDGACKVRIPITRHYSPPSLGSRTHRI